MHVDLLSISYLCQSGYEDWVLLLTRSARLRPHLRVSEPLLPYPGLLAPPVASVSSLRPVPRPRWQLGNIGYRPAPHEPSFLSSRPPWRLAPTPVTQTDGANPDPSPRLQGRQKNLTRGGRGDGVEVWLRLCCGGEWRVLLCHHGNTLPRFLWTAFRPAQGPWMNTNSIGITARGPKRPHFRALKRWRACFCFDYLAETLP